MIRVVATALIVTMAAAGIQTWRLAAEVADHAETRASHAEQIAGLERTARVAEANARAEEKRRADALQEVIHETEQKLDAARADADAAADAGQRLRAQLAAIASGCSRSTSHTDPAEAGPPADATADLLADVQRRLGEATQQFAAFADQSHAAGTACQRSYDALIKR